VRAIVGDLMEPTEHDLARFRVRGFPDETVLAEIDNEEI
jgi:hypothetical protein